MNFRKLRWFVVPFALLMVIAVVLANIDHTVTRTQTITKDASGNTVSNPPSPVDPSSSSVDDARRSAGNTVAVLTSAFLSPEADFRNQVDEVATQETASQLRKLYSGYEADGKQVPAVGGDAMAKSLGYSSLADFQQKGRYDFQALQYKVKSFEAGKSAVVGVYGITTVITKKNQRYFQQDVPSIQILRMVWQDGKWRYDKQLRPLKGEVPSFTESGQSFTQILAKYKLVLENQRYKTYD